MKNYRKSATAGLVFLALFIVWTVAVKYVGVAAIGPLGTSVGFSGINGAFHSLTGEHFAIYDITDKLSVIPFVIVGIFGITGVYQLIKGKSLKSVDRSLVALGVFYFGVLIVFVAFEKVFFLNYRPVLIEGALECSYPSSTTMLAMSVLITADLQQRSRIKNTALRGILSAVIYAFTAFMVIGRLISGVHWLTDIIGGALISTALILFYAAAAGKPAGRHEEKKQ